MHSRVCVIMGYPLRYHWISLHSPRSTPWDFNGFPYMSIGNPLRFQWIALHVLRDTPKDFNGLCQISQGLSLRTPIHFRACPNGYPLGFHWMFLHFPMGTP